MSLTLIKDYITRLKKILPKDYNTFSYREDLASLKQCEKQYEETKSVPLSCYVVSSNVRLYKQLQNMFYMFGLLSYDGKYVLSQKQVKELEDVLKELEKYEKY